MTDQEKFNEATIKNFNQTLESFKKLTDCVKELTARLFKLEREIEQTKNPIQ